MISLCHRRDVHGGLDAMFNSDTRYQEIPEGCVVKVIPASAWAVFPCRGPLPQSLQEVNTRMWSEWLPSCKNYRLAANLNIEMYAPPAENPEDTYSEIWLPVEKIG